MGLSYFSSNMVNSSRLVSISPFRSKNDVQQSIRSTVISIPACSRISVKSWYSSFRSILPSLLVSYFLKNFTSSQWSALMLELYIIKLQHQLMKKLRPYRLAPRANKIWLPIEPDPVFKYTFLESNLMTPYRMMKNDLTINIRDEMKSKMHEIDNIIVKDFTKEKLLQCRFLDKPAQIYEGIINQNRQIIFGKQHFNYYWHIRLLHDINILLPQIWRKVFENFFKIYGQIPSNDIKVSLVINEFLKKCHVKNSTFTRFKFCFDEHLLSYFASFKYHFQNIHSNHHFYGLSHEILMSQIFNKVKLSQDMDFYLARKYYERIFPKVDDALKLERYPIDKTSQLYLIYSRIGLDSPQIINKFEKNLQKGIGSATVEEIQSFVPIILSSWRQLGKYNPETFKLTRNFFLNYTLPKQHDAPINILYDLVCSGVEDKQILNKFLEFSNKKIQIINSHFIIEKAESIRHYLYTKGYTLGAEISQARIPFSFKQNHPKLIEELFKKFPENSRLKATRKITKQSNTQNKPEQPKVLTGTQKFFVQAMEKFHPSNSQIKLIIGPYLFHYQIDIALIDGDQIYAIQFLGQHYQRSQEKFDGKTKMKFSLFSFYGIKNIIIDCNSQTVQNICQVNKHTNPKLAYEYIMKEVDKVRKKKC